MMNVNERRCTRDNGRHLACCDITSSGSIPAASGITIGMSVCVCVCVYGATMEGTTPEIILWPSCGEDNENVNNYVT